MLKINYLYLYTAVVDNKNTTSPMILDNDRLLIHYLELFVRMFLFTYPYCAIIPCYFEMGLLQIIH